MSGTVAAAKDAGDGVTVVMPAYHEEANLAGTVEDMLGTLAEIGEQHAVVIVNDGSGDRTGEIADSLAARYPSRVRVVHHEVNKGYGAAVRTGIAAALEHTNSAWLFLTDSDGQFRGEQLPEFLSAARSERADAVIGFRPRRADPMARKVNAWLWTRASRVLLGVAVRDMDCAYKLIGRRMLEDVTLHGNAALISPEILMRIKGRGAHVLQRPVNHYPRLHGEQTGAKLSVILLSLIGLLGLWWERVNEAPSGRGPRRLPARAPYWSRARQWRGHLTRHNTAHRSRPGYRGLKGSPALEPAQTRTTAAFPGTPGKAAAQATPRHVLDRDTRKRRWPASRATTIVTVTSTVISVLAYLHFYPHGQTLAYMDARSHLMIARRVIFADTPGAGQLGAVWLPLPHILLLALAWDGWAYYSGFAGSIVMMACYVLLTVLAYKYTWQLTRRRTAAAVTATIIALNPNMLYMQSTPMTELLMFATMMGAAYGLLRWIQTDADDRLHMVYLLGAGASLLACALTRYEGWILAVTLAAVVAYCALFNQGIRHGLQRESLRRNWHLTEGQTLAFGILGATGPLAWMAWNWVIEGSPLSFQTGQYARPSNWVGSDEQAVHHWWIALRTYEIATVDTISLPVAGLALAGLVLYLWRKRLSPESLPALSLLVMFPMFVVMLYAGQRPLHVWEYYHSFYNIRFGLVMLLPAALLAGYLVAEAMDFAARLGRRWRPLGVALPVIVIGAIALSGAAALRTGNIVTLEEPLAANTAASATTAAGAADWLRAHYDGGLLLMESYGNEEVAFAAHVPMQDQVYEGSYRIWGPSLAHPGYHEIAWVVMHHSSQDEVYAGLHASIVRYGYRLAWTNHDYLIYRWSGTAAQLAANAMLGRGPAGTAGTGALTGEKN